MIIICIEGGLDYLVRCIICIEGGLDYLVRWVGVSCFLLCLVDNKSLMAEVVGCLLYLARAVRSFWNGVFSCFLVYYFIACLNYQAAGVIAHTLAASALAAVLKSRLIAAVYKRKGRFAALVLIYACFVPGLLMLTLLNYEDSLQMTDFAVFFIVGFYPVDGEDLLLFEENQSEFMCQRSLSRIRNQISYLFIGYLCQALGALLALMYMAYEMETINFLLQIRMHQLFVVVYLLGIVNLAFLTAFQLMRREKKNQHKPINNQPHFDHGSLAKRLKTAHFINGLALGSLCAPFMAYFLDLRFNLYHDAVGRVLFAFFLLKGVGEEAVNRLPSLRPLFECWNALSIVSLAAVYFLTDADQSVYCLLFAFPLWNFGRAVLRSKVQSLGLDESEANAIQTEGRLWERGGTAVGILLSSFAFSVLYFKPHFAYGFLLSALAKALSQIYTHLALSERSMGIQKRSGQKIQLIQFKISTQNLPLRQSRKNTTYHILDPQKQRKFFKVTFILVFIASCYYFLTSPFKSDSWGSPYQLKPEKVTAPESLKLFNSSLAHFWVREGVTEVTLIDCDAECVKEVSNRDEYYAQISFDGAKPEWVHFPNMEYFRSDAEVRKAMSPLEKHPFAKGFSLAWDDPLRYNKMPYEIYGLFATVAKEYGFHYAEMPSLNLRGVEYKIIMVFTRNERIPVTLPSFVQRQPPKNYLAIELTFKLVSNHQYLREFIIYHLNMGYDKFFLYNNDRDPTDPNFYKEYRDVGSFYQKCLYSSFEEEYANMQQIWEDFYDHIVYIPLRIGDMHPQGIAHFNYGLFYRQEVLFTSFPDLDEFLHSPSGQYYPDVLKKLVEEDDAGSLKYISHNFLSRVCLKEQLAIEQFRWLHQFADRRTVKTTVMTRLIVEYAIHGRSSKNGRHLYIRDSRHDYRIIHYKITQTYDEFTGRDVYGTDESLRPLVAGLKEACGGKCSDSLKFTCTPDVYTTLMDRFCLQK